MIEIKYYRKAHRLTVTGHAASAEKGKDLVCAGVTALVYTMALNVQQMTASKNIRRPLVFLGEGRADISCSPVHGMGAIVTVIFDTVAMGLEYIAENNPEYVSYKVM